MTDPADVHPADVDPNAAGRPGPAAPPVSAPLSEGALALRAALRRAVWTAGLATVIGTALLAAVFGLLTGWPGVWGALIGAGLAFGFLATTAVTMSLTAGRDALVAGGVLMGSWLLKVVLVLVVLGLLRDLDFYSRPALVLGMMLGLIVTLWAEYRYVSSARIPHVEPR